MYSSFRRVVTGHDEHGVAVVLADDRLSRRATALLGWTGVDIWETADSPVNNQLLLAPGGQRTVLRTVEMAPGAFAGMHRTWSIDYAVVLSGSCRLLLDGGEIRLEPGDVAIQRGTLHSWRNEGTEPCRLLLVLIDAMAITIDGVRLEPIYDDDFPDGFDALNAHVAKKPSEAAVRRAVEES